jgi:hypothetical protein
VLGPRNLALFTEDPDEEVPEKHGKSYFIISSFLPTIWLI